MTATIFFQNSIATARSEYWEKGYTVLRNIYSSDEISACREECSQLWSIPGLTDDLNLRSEFRLDAGGTYVMDRLDPVLDLAPKLKAVAFEPVLIDALHAILGMPVALLKCKLIRKDPQTKGYLPHQDFLYWRWLNMPADVLCSVGIPLHSSNKETGGIEFFPGCHTHLLESESGDTEEDFNVKLLQGKPTEIPSLEPGDALIFHALAPHRSGTNSSTHPRTLLLPSYAASRQENLYSLYYQREIRRRCSALTGFERFEISAKNISKNSGVSTSTLFSRIA